MAEITIQIPGYELERLAGRGGMAEVYVARQVSLGRKVALKILLQTLSPDSNFTERFEREAKTAASLQHPNIIKIFDTGMHEGRYYIAMEYLGSKTLADLIVDGMSPSLAIKYLAKLANALEYAHAKGVIHRDIKPTNVLLYPDNEPVLSDFGISRLVDSNSSLTATGMMIGSPRYMSPEQAKGAIVDSRSDLYALGVVFYEMLTGTFPYNAEDTLALMYKHVHDDIPRLPPSLSRFQPVIDGLMAKEPDQRLSTAGEILPLLDIASEQKNHFSEINETVFIPPEIANISATNSTVPYTPKSGIGNTRENSPDSSGSPQFSATESRPVPDDASPEKSSNGKSRHYGKYALLAIVLISAVGLYQFLTPAVFTDSPPAVPDSMDDIIVQLESKLNAGDYESARILLKQGLAEDALDKRLLVIAERVRLGIKQQKDAIAANKLVEETLVSAQEKISSGQYDAASTLIAQARQVGADKARIASLEQALELAKAADDKQKQYATLLEQSRAALENKNFEVAEQAAKEAMVLKPEATEVKQLLIEIEDSRIAASREETLVAAEAKVSSGQYGRALTLIAQAEKLGADQTRIAAIERALTLALEADDKHKQYVTLLTQSRAALETRDFDDAEQAARDAMLLEPESAETKQLLIDIEDSRAAASREERQATLQGIIDHALGEGDIDKARETFELLDSENPDAAVISHFGTLISSREKELGARDSFDKHFSLAKSYYEQRQLMQALAEVEQALLIDPEHVDAQHLLRLMQFEREQKIEELKQDIFDALAKDDLSGSKKALEELNSLGVSDAEVDAGIADLEQRQAADMLALTIQTTPADAAVRILNIGPAYRPGMKLEAGSYKVEVSKPGYKQHVSMFELKQGQEMYTVELEINPSEATSEGVSEQPTPTSTTFIEPEMVKISGGRFQMGCVIDWGCKDDEKPAHEVQVSAFELGRYEVTFDEWDSCVEHGGCKQRLEDKGWGRGKRPAINASWDDAQEYIQWLSQKTGKQYRLPSEAEWEYAARGGTSGSYSFDGKITVDKANYDGNYIFDDSPKGKFREKTLPVGSFPANPWGLYDMHGNVWEWTQDCLHENYEGAPNIAKAWTTDGDCSKRGLRGGSWNSAPGNLRSSNRGWFIPGRRYFIDGFRVARTLSP
jgi:formylglycine-generating enzyme required for sulfatase activity/serine/threonine protein kinase